MDLRITNSTVQKYGFKPSGGDWIRDFGTLYAGSNCHVAGHIRNGMPRYFFEIKNGPGLIDPVGLDCRNDREAIAKAASLAAEIATVVRSAAGKWHLTVLNSERKEIGSVPIKPKGRRYDSEEAGR